MKTHSTQRCLFPAITNWFFILNSLLFIMANSKISLAGDEKSNPTILVGIEYFSGWWKPLPNKWQDASGKDWRSRFPERVPLLGEYNEQETMNKEITEASTYGVDFFSMLWYYNKADKEQEPNSRFLESGITTFIHSPEASKMRFMIEFCNHPPYEVKTDQEWEECIAKWMPYLSHPSYLRINGKLVFKVHGGQFFLAQNQNDKNRCKERLEILRRAVREKGLGEMMIGCGVGAYESITAQHFAPGLFDFTATYMDVPGLAQQEQDYPYPTLSEYINEGRTKHFQDALPYVPFIAAGWCPRPWPDKRAYFSFPSPEEWKQALVQIKNDLLTQPQLGFPGQKGLTIYAWNEFGEGGIVAPTKGEGYNKLKAIQEVFKPKP